MLGDVGFQQLKPFANLKMFPFTLIDMHKIFYVAIKQNRMTIKHF